MRKARTYGGNNFALVVCWNTQINCYNLNESLHPNGRSLRFDYATYAVNACLGWIIDFQEFPFRFTSFVTNLKLSIAFVLQWVLGRKNEKLQGRENDTSKEERFHFQCQDPKQVIKVNVIYENCIGTHIISGVFQKQEK